MYPSTRSYFYSSNLLLCVINFQHQPLIKSNINKNISLPWCSHQCNGNQIDNLPISTSSHLYSSTTKSTKPIDLPPFALELLFLCCHALSYSPSPLTVCSILGHPLLVVNLFHIIYNQTKFPTQAHKSP
jgi:hypothetical protein